MPELVEEHLVGASEELDPVAFNKLQIVDNHVFQINWVWVFEKATISLSELHHVVFFEFEYVLFSCLQVEDNHDEAVWVDSGPHQVHNEVDSVDLAATLAHQVATAKLVCCG